jgi:hypothetical protein
MKALASKISPSLLECKSGLWWRHKVLAPDMIAAWREVAGGFYEKMETVARTQGPKAVHNKLGPGQKYAPTAASFTLEAVYGTEKSQCILQAVAASPARQFIEDELGGQALCDLDQSWVRRQYAPSHRPPGNAPHAWHQDGALGYDFNASMGSGPTTSGLLPMVTCWLPLSPCGADAPGLELLTAPLAELLPPEKLADQFIRTRWVDEEFWKPVMAPGDLVCFRGEVLHRTQVTPAMQSDRTSIELRFFGADWIPARLARDRFISLN